MNHINIEEFAGGALSVQVNKAIEEVTENIQDPNTDAQKARRATITIEFRPSEARDYAQTKISMKTALAPAAPINTGLVMGKNLETGECEVYEYGNTIRGRCSCVYVTSPVNWMLWTHPQVKSSRMIMSLI